MNYVEILLARNKTKMRMNIYLAEKEKYDYV
jgi:hypothetical protein